MSKKGSDKVVHRRVVVKKGSPYAPMLKLIYRSCIGLGILVVAWMAYEIFNTARVGLKEHNQQQQEYREAMGVKDDADKAGSDDSEQQQDMEKEEEEQPESEQEQGKGN